jgi:hypothetical protein
MELPQIRASGSMVAIALLFSACLSPQESNIDSNTLRPNINTNFNSNTDANSNTSEDDETALNTLINLPFVPKENAWRKERITADANSNVAPEPTDYKLTAVLKFSENDTQELISKSKGNKMPFKTELEAESWFPAELIAKGETSGDSTLKGLAYGVEDFVKAPYSSGVLIQIDDTDYFVLVLQTK